MVVSTTQPLPNLPVPTTTLSKCNRIKTGKVVAPAGLQFRVVPFSARGHRGVGRFLSGEDARGREEAAGGSLPQLLAVGGALGDVELAVQHCPPLHQLPHKGACTKIFQVCSFRLFKRGDGLSIFLIGNEGSPKDGVSGKHLGSFAACLCFEPRRSIMSL